MKKVLSLALAVVMLFAVCVPAFAAELSNDGAQSAYADVKTRETDKDGNDPSSWVVSYPAETEIPWGETETAVEYTVTTHLKTGKQLEVLCGKSTNMVNAAGTELPFTLEGENDVFVGAVATAESHVATVCVAEAAWNAVPIDTYTGQILFTASVI